MSLIRFPRVANIISARIELVSFIFIRVVVQIDKGEGNNSATPATTIKFYSTDPSHTMKVRRCFGIAIAAVALKITAMLKTRFVNCTDRLEGLQRLGTRITVGKLRLIRSSDYVHLLTSSDGNTNTAIHFKLRKQRNNNDRGLPTQQQQVWLQPTTTTSQVPPIKKVRQDSSAFIEYKTQNNTEASPAGCTFSIHPMLPLQLYAEYTESPTDRLIGSEDCYASECLSQIHVDAPYSKVMKGHCGAAICSIVIRVYTQFGNAESNNPSVPKILKCCPNACSSYPSMATTNESVIPLSTHLSEYPKMEPTTHASESNPSTTHTSKPFKKQNRVKDVSATTAIVTDANVDAGASPSGASTVLHTSRDLNWNKMYQKLLVYKMEHGNTRVPQQYRLDRQLGEWVHNQRQAYKKKKMPVERANLLDSLGFHWVTQYKNPWDKMYARLLDYRNEHNGDTNVALRYEKDPMLGKWTCNQRYNYKNGKMSAEHASLLTSIGFDWDTRTSIWNEMYHQLIAYKNAHNGATAVPHRDKENPQLGEWVRTQRKAYKKKKLSTERLNLLNSIGFEWGKARSTWDDMYALLVVYKQEHKNANVPQRYKQDLQLGKLVSTQRRAYKKKLITEEHASLLNAIGFEWEVKTQPKVKLGAGTGVSSLGRLTAVQQNNQGNGVTTDDKIFTSTAVDTSDVVTTAAQFRDAATRLHDLSRSTSLGKSYIDTLVTHGAKKAINHANGANMGCNSIRKVSQVLRMMCSTKRVDSSANFKILNLEILEAYSKHLVKVGSFERHSISTITKLFGKKGLKASDESSNRICLIALITMLPYGFPKLLVLLLMV